MQLHGRPAIHPKELGVCPPGDRGHWFMRSFKQENCDKMCALNTWLGLKCRESTGRLAD